MINFSKLKSVLSGSKEVLSESSDDVQQDTKSQEKMTRRQALRKLGLAGGMTLLATLTIDDLARISAEKLQQNQVTSEIGNSLAEEFKNAGVAFADDLGGFDYEYQAAIRPPSPQQIQTAFTKCAGASGNDFWVCVGNNLGKATFAANFEYIWCAKQDPGGNNGSCPGYPNHTPCEPALRTTTPQVCQSCCEAKAALCVVMNGPNSVAKCQNDMTMCNIKTCSYIQDP